MPPLRVLWLVEVEGVFNTVGATLLGCGMEQSFLYLLMNNSCGKGQPTLILLWLILQNADSSYFTNPFLSHACYLNVPGHELTFHW